MCRFTVYKGRSIPLGDILIIPDNSLLHQSRDASYHPGVTDPQCRRNIRVNGDGFGIGWYSDNPNSPTLGSCLFKLTSPAWSNINFRNIGHYVCSPVVFGHVRAASDDINLGEEMIISDENCHPFKYGRYTFMHNGFIPDFIKVKRAFCLTLAEDVFSVIRGSTDSEHIFALFLNLLPDKNIQLTAKQLADTIDATISKIIEISASCGIYSPGSINLAVTDGINVIATRFRNGSQEPPSLYYSFGKHFSAQEGNFQDLEVATASEIVISSAPLSRKCLEFIGNERCQNWVLVPKDHMLICVGHPTQMSIVECIELRPIVTPLHIPTIESSSNFSPKTSEKVITTAAPVNCPFKSIIAISAGSCRVSGRSSTSEPGSPVSISMSDNGSSGGISTETESKHKRVKSKRNVLKCIFKF